MELLNNYHKISSGASEETMQEQVDKFLQGYKFVKITDQFPFKKELPKIVLREFRVPEVGRISDHVVLLNKRRVVNLECKLDDIGGVIRQAEDHLAWCDYSIVIMPPDGRYLANSYKTELIRKGIGLWYWFKGIGIFEFILPSYNRKKDSQKRETIIKRIMEREQK